VTSIGPTNRVAVRRLFAEALEGVRGQPTRSALTGLGTLVGVGAVVTVLGLTATANGQIADTFSAQSSTLVQVETDTSAGASKFPDGSEERVASIDGVTGVGIVSAIDTAVAPSVHPGDPEAGSEPPRVSGVTPGYWDAVGAPLLQGRLIDVDLAEFPVAVVGQRVAIRLGITDVDDQVMIRFRGRDFLVVGIVGPAARDQVTAGDIAIPQAFVRHWLSPGEYVEQLIVTTKPGAGESTARQVPTAIDPYRANSVITHYPPRARVVDDAVSAELRRLFVMLAIVSMLVGAIGIANVALMSVVERRREIGLRRALGARRRHIICQFLFEAGLLGGLGGAAGGAVGQLAVIGVALTRSWTPTLDPLLTIASAPLGLLVGLCAGIYPAMRAAQVPPMDALRSLQ
jgi:putative ABC transport system permease protein